MTILGKNIFYDGKIDLTPIFVLKKKFRKKYCFYGKLWTKECFLHIIADNGMLTTHCNNLSTHHYHLTYHPCFDTQFCHSQTTQQYFRAVAMSSRKKQKRSSYPFVPRRVVKRKKRIGLTKLSLAPKGSYYTQHESEKVVPGSCVTVILWLYSSVLIM